MPNFYSSFKERTFNFNWGWGKFPDKAYLFSGNSVLQSSTPVYQGILNFTHFGGLHTYVIKAENSTSYVK